VEDDSNAAGGNGDLGYYFHQTHRDSVKVVASEARDGVKVADVWWHDLDLPKVMASLWKQWGGGSVFLGVREETTAPVRAWREMKLDLGLIFKGSRKKIWADGRNAAPHVDHPDFVHPDFVARVGPLQGESECSGGGGGGYEYAYYEGVDNVSPQGMQPSSSPSSSSSSGEGVHHIACPEDVPVFPGRGTGSYVCHGVVLDQSQRSALADRILDHTRRRLLWYPQLPTSDPVTLTFHPVKGGPPDACVVEVKVRPFPGLVFHDVEGPQSFVVETKGMRTELRRLTVEECMRQIGNSGYLQESEIFA
jgi:hypothetical protein